jgi:hypothetical protein
VPVRLRGIGARLSMAERAAREQAKEQQMATKQREPTAEPVSPAVHAEAHTDRSADRPRVSARGSTQFRLPAHVEPKRLLLWGGLGVIAVAGILEWPVAVAIGAGSYVAERLARDDVKRDLRPSS